MQLNPTKNKKPNLILVNQMLHALFNTNFYKDRVYFANIKYIQFL